MSTKETKKPGRARTITMLLVIVVVGAGIGALAGLKARDFLSTTHTTAQQWLSPPFEGRKRIYVLALGEDETGSKRKEVHGRSDTIMVAAVDLERRDVRAISIPRDTRVAIPGREGEYKINSAFAMGGPELSVQAAEALLGVKIDYYVKTNIAGLKKTVDLLGGVEIDIEKNMRYRDRRGGLYINLKKGYRHLTGDQALQYVRFRHDALGDISRMQRQQKFLRALARRMMVPENVLKLETVIDEIYKNVDTNMSGRDLLELARLSKRVQVDQVQMETLPAVPQMIGHISYMIADPVKTGEMVDRLLYFKSPKPTVEVLNGTGVPGAAAKISDLLTKNGYQVVSTGNAPKFDYALSEIHSRTADPEQARMVGTTINCTRITQEPRQPSAKAEVTVIVGKDLNL